MRKILFIGGTGIISSACSQALVENGDELFLLTRGHSFRKPPSGVQLIHGDIRQPATVIKLIAGHAFDSVVDWIAFTPDQVQVDLDLFRGITKQYVFISSASAYQTPPASLPVTESTILDNPFWEYSRNKIACEELLVDAYRKEKFPVTIVRPSHTYDKTLLPFHGGWSILQRMMEGKPVIIHGDGTSLWTLTHHRDFACGFNGLLGNSHAIGDVFHITSDEWLSWNQIYELLAEAVGGVLNPVHIPSDFINRFDPVWGASLLGDKTHSMVFDNAKIKRIVPEFAARIPFSSGAKEIANWYLSNPAQQKIDHEYLLIYEKILAEYTRVFSID